jgi:putative transposase
MSQSLARLLVHLVFSTKNREPALPDAIRIELHSYIGGIIANDDGSLLKAGSVSDHIHLLLTLPRTHAPADLVQDIKTGSSKWLKNAGPRFAGFHWQSGYGMFSVSSSHRAVVESYLDHQAEHHRAVTFQDEYRQLLGKHGIEFNERYVWD